MDEIKQIIDFSATEGRVLLDAPVTSVVALGLVILVVRAFYRHTSKGVVDALRATNEMLRERVQFGSDHLEQYKERLAESESELEKAENARPAADSVAKQHSLAASAIISSVRADLEKTAAALALPAYLAAASGTVEPVPFEGMEDTEAAKKPDEDK